MSEETTLTQGGSEAVAAIPEVKIPKSDAEASLSEAPKVETTAKPEDEESEKRKNRTAAYIERIKRERNEAIAELTRSRQPTQPSTATKGADSDKEPTPEDFEWDLVAFNKAHAKWAVASEFKRHEETNKREESQRKQVEVATSYNDRIADFAADHPDFHEVVSTIPYQLGDEIQAAIMAHAKGPEIAYHLGINDDDAFQLASIQPQLATAAVERIAKRISGAPKAEETTQTAAPPVAAPKPVSQAPAPVRTVSGRAPAETPQEKLTDDQWYAKDRESRRKR